MPLSSSKRHTRKAELPKLWLYRYGELGSRIPVLMRVSEGKNLSVTVDDEVSMSSLMFSLYML